MTNKDLRILLKKERQLKHVVETIKEFVQNYQEIRDKNQLEARITKLDDVYDSFCSTRAEIELLLEDVDADDEYHEVDETVETHDRRRDNENETILKHFVNEYFALKQSLQAFQSTAGSSHSIGSMMSPVHQLAAPAVRVKLPELKLPTFNGNLRDWIAFRDTFRNLIIDNSQLSDIDKFTYLRTSLTADAFQEIGSIELTSANFPIAWKSLESRYENKKLLVKSHLDALFAINPMRRENFESLNQVVSEFDKHLQMLDKLGESTNNWSTILVYLLTSKLDSSTLRMWETEHRSRDVPEFRKLLEFLKNHCIVLQSVETRNTQSTEPKKPMRSIISYSGIQTGCPFCGDTQHRPFQCKKFATMKVEERRDVVKTNQLCFNCLSHGHMSRGCSRGSCRICGQQHHTLLHLAPNQGSSTQPTQTRWWNGPNSRNQTETDNQTFNQSITNSLPIIDQHTLRQTPPQIDTPVSHSFILFANEAKVSRSVLLATAVVVLEDQFGNTSPARALLDSGSQMCFMSENMSQKLKFERSRETISVSGIGQSTEQCNQSIIARVKSRVSHFSVQEEFYVLPQLTMDLPTSKVDIHDLNIPQTINLADPHFNDPGSIDLIIGATLFFDLLKNESMKLERNRFTIHNTELGWIVCGRIQQEQSSENTANFSQTPNNLKDCQGSVARDSENATIKSLEVSLEPRWDCLEFKVSPRKRSKVRGKPLFSDLSRIFDPIVMIILIVAAVKTFVQTLWNQKVFLDDSRRRTQNHVQAFRESLVELKLLKIQQWFALIKERNTTRWMFKFKEKFMRIDQDLRRTVLSTSSDVAESLSRSKRLTQGKISSQTNSMYLSLVDGELRVGGRLENTSKTEGIISSMLFCVLPIEDNELATFNA